MDTKVCIIFHFLPLSSKIFHNFFNKYLYLCAHEYKW